MKTLALALLSATACAAAAPSPAPPPGPPAAAVSPGPAVPAPAPAPAVTVAAAPNAAPPAEGPLVFIEDDYPRALAEARARHLPLFVDAWATWCHTCLSMRSYVFPDPAMRRLAPRFVWLALDTEREGNAPQVTRLGVRALPTLYVLDPATERPVLAWSGWSLTATELAPLLEDAERAVQHGDAGGEAGAALLRGHRLAAEGHAEEAIEAYRAALAAAPADWPRRPQAVDALVTELTERKDAATCVTTAATEAPRMPAGTALADVLRQAMSCAEDLPAAAPERARLAELAALGERVASDAAQPILADDRSDLYDYVVHAMREVGRADDARRVAHAWAAFLEQQAAQAPTPAARAVFDAHRLLAYVALGEPQRAVPMLQQSERDFPDDYNPPARLATAYREMKAYDEAVAAIRRALPRAYGPRKLRLYALEADLYEARHDRAAARRTLEEALAFARTVPLTGGYPKLRDSLEKRLTAMH